MSSDTLCDKLALFWGQQVQYNDAFVAAELCKVDVLMFSMPKNSRCNQMLNSLSIQHFIKKC